MLTSEEEAKEKWCPQARCVVTIDLPETGKSIAIASANRSNKNDALGACKGSVCMFWRWQGWKTVGHISIAQDPKEENREGPRLGFCGLAREPSPYGPR